MTILHCDICGSSWDEDEYLDCPESMDKVHYETFRKERNQLRAQLDIAQKFHDVAIKERDLERHHVNQLRDRLAAAEEELTWRDARIAGLETSLQAESSAIFVAADKLSAAERRASKAEAKLATSAGAVEKCIDIWERRCTEVSVERDAMRAEVERLNDHIKDVHRDADEDEARLRDDNDRLRAALRKYGRHDKGCDPTVRVSEREPGIESLGDEWQRIKNAPRINCTCGYEAALVGDEQ
jgi:chromosome segregation ATPase